MAKDQRNKRRYGWLRRAAVGIVGLGIAALIGCQVWATSQQQTANNNRLNASGIIQAEEVIVASEFGGRIAEIQVAEGDEVTVGHLLVRLDTELLDAQIEAAEATVEMAEAGLAQAKAGARPGHIAAAEAQLAQAMAGRAVAQQAVSDTHALVGNPQDINLQIAVTAARVEAARQRYEQAVALKDAIEIGKNQFEDARSAINDAGGSGHHKIPVPGMPGHFIEYDVPHLPLAAHQLPNMWWQAWVGVNASQAEQEGLAASLAQLYAQRENPQAMVAQAEEALSGLAQATAQVAAAQAQVSGLKAGASKEQIAALEARVAQAQTGRDALIIQRDMMLVKSPMNGTVVNVAVHPGEVATPGSALITVADISDVILTVYVPETSIGQLQMGQPVQVSVDSFPDRVFEGRVSYISDQAEFTPRNVATQEERVNLVFSVEIRIVNEDGALKPGMPADAAFGN
ncbi:MAG: efflux RND transporter periplasmic adaptor subunit [Chloroflexota bacterium]|nr:efflux RND transporter periplasmic adaptor subunit [Chloroflexota bacterium]